MPLKKILPAILFILSSFYAQAQLLGISSSGFTHKDTLQFASDNFQFSFYLQNYDTVPVSGNNAVHLNFSLADSSLGLVNLYSDSVFIAFTDTIHISRSFPVSNPQIKNGINIIVIWPRLSGVQNSTQDTLRDSVFVIKNTGVPIVDILSIVSIFPNPATNQINIESYAEENIRSIYLYDNRGRLVKALPYQTLIDISDYERGLYMLEINWRDGRKNMIKLLKE